MKRDPSGIDALGQQSDSLDRRLGAIETARRNAESWRREGRFRPILILLAIVLIGGGASLYFWVQGEAEKRKSAAIQQQVEKTEAALREADEERQNAIAWKRAAIAGQFRHIIASADKALHEGKRDFARALTLAAHEIMTTKEPAVNAGISYKNSLLATLPSNVLELYASQGERVSEPVLASYSDDGNVIAWTVPSGDRYVNLTNATTGTISKRFQRTGDDVRSLSLSKNGKQLAVVNAKRGIELFGDLPNEAKGTLSSERFDAVAFGETVQGPILVGVSEGTLRAWRTNPGDRIVPIPAAQPNKAEDIEATNFSASAVQCVRMRCAYFDGTKLSIYEVDGVIRQVASGADILTDLKQVGDGDKPRPSNQIVMLGDTIHLRAGAQWRSYQQSNQFIEKAPLANLNDSYWPLVPMHDSKSFLTVAKRQNRSFVLSASLPTTKQSDELDERRIGIVDSADVIAISPDGTSVFALSKTDGNRAFLKVVRFEPFPSQACKDGCGNLFVSNAGVLYMGGQSTVLRYDPIMRQFNPIIDRLTDSIRMQLSPAADPEQPPGVVAADEINVVGMDANADTDQIYVLFSAGREKAKDFQVAIFDVGTGKLIAIVKRNQTTSEQPHVTSDRRETSPVVDEKAEFKKTLMRLREAARDGLRPFVVGSWDDEAPSVLVWPALSHNKSEGFQLDFIAGGRLKVQGSIAVALSSRNELEVISFDTPSRSFLVRLRENARDVIDFGILSDSRLYVAYSRGLVEILDTSQSPTRSIRTYIPIDQISWSPTHHEFAVVGRLNDTNLQLIKWFDAQSGALVRTMEFNTEISALQLLNSSEMLIFSDENYLLVPALHAFANERQVSQYAMAITPRWLLKRDIEKEGSLILASDEEGTSDKLLDRVGAECRFPNQSGSEPLAVLYARACKALAHTPGSEGFRALGMAHVARSYLMKANVVVNETGFLLYELLGVGEDDPVATAMFSSRLHADIDSSRRCERLSLTRRLLENSILGGVVAPDYFAIVLHCDGIGGVKTSNETLERIQTLAESGDPIAHAVLGIINERDEQRSNALAHYQAASLILHAVGQYLIEEGFGQSMAAWQEVEHVIGLRRATLARLLDPMTALDALERAQHLFEQATSQGRASSPVALFSPHSASNLASTVSQANVAAGMTKGEQKLRIAATAGEDQVLTKVLIEARYIAAEQYDRDEPSAAAPHKTGLQALWVGILDSAADLLRIDSFSSAVSPVVLRLLSQHPEPDRYIELLKKLVDHVIDSNTSLDAHSLDPIEQKHILDFLMSDPLIETDEKTMVKLALASMAATERSYVDSKWVTLAKAQEKVTDLLSRQASLTPFEAQIASLRWNYIDIANTLGRSLTLRNGDGKLSGELEATGRKILADGIGLHSMVQEVLQDKEKLARGLFQAGYVAEKDKKYDKSIEYYDKLIQLDPKHVYAYNNRGIAHKARYKLDSAIHDYDQALQLDPKYAKAYLNRGVAYLAKGDSSRTLEDCERALQLDPKFTSAFNVCGIAHTHMGDFDSALQNFDRAILLDPKADYVYRWRARAKLFSNRSVSAVDDLVTATTLDPLDHYNVIWLHIARARVGQNDEDEIASNAERLDHAEWPWPVVGFLMGALSPEAFRSAANSLDPKTGRDHTCDADFYLAIDEQRKRAHNEARKLFESAADSCPKDTAEYLAAKFELKALP